MSEEQIKVVYNACFGGFRFSKDACKRLVEMGVAHADMYGSSYVCRHDPNVVKVVEELGNSASGSSAKLQIEVIRGNAYRIDDYDGSESVQEPDDIEWIEVGERPSVVELLSEWSRLTSEERDVLLDYAKQLGGK